MDAIGGAVSLRDAPARASDHDETSAPPATPESGSSLLAKDAHVALLEALPVGVLVIDRLATVHFANAQIGALLGVPLSAIVGRSALDFVVVEDLGFAADLLAAGLAYEGEVMGPSRMRYLDAAGVAHWTQVWAYEAPAALGVDGFILALTYESVRDVLVTAVSSLALDDELDRTLSAVASSACAMPLSGTGVVLVAEPSMGDDGIWLRAIGSWPIDAAAMNAFGTPWRRALVDGVHADVDDVASSDLATGTRAALLAAGVRSVFVRPIRDIAGVVAGVYVVFRRDLGPATMNQVDHLNDSVRLSALAFAQARRRSELESAANTDSLTGIANRTAFNDRLEADRRHADVLFVDLDHFKSVNDTFGHQVGDCVIREAAQRVAASIRRTDMVYRTGGDEFVVVCEPTGSDPAQRTALAQRIIERLVAPFVVGEHIVRIGATVGIAQALDGGLNATVRAADAALYQAKKRGRAGWSHHV